MATEPKRGHNLKMTNGRIRRAELLLVRLEKRIETLENKNAALKAQVSKPSPPGPPGALVRLQKHNASLKGELSKLRARVDHNTLDSKQQASQIARIIGLREPVQALVRSLKQAPGAPFSVWRTWMLSTFRKQGLYRRQMFR